MRPLGGIGLLRVLASRSSAAYHGHDIRVQTRPLRQLFSHWPRDGCCARPRPRRGPEARKGCGRTISASRARGTGPGNLAGPQGKHGPRPGGFLCLDPEGTGGRRRMRKWSRRARTHARAHCNRGQRRVSSASGRGPQGGCVAGPSACLQPGRARAVRARVWVSTRSRLFAHAEPRPFGALECAHLPVRPGEPPERLGAA